MPELLNVRNLRVHFRTNSGIIRSVEGLDLTIRRGETLALVGESGCGKSVSSMAIAGLLPLPPARVSGEIMFDGIDLLALPEHKRREYRGRRIAYIFQEPMSSLNPVTTIGDQICEGMKYHMGLTGRRAFERGVELLEMAGITEPTRRMKEYPHHLSGGMRQRVMIAIALSCEPQLLIADEPTTALDVTIQAQILDLIKELSQRLGTSVLLITHDLGVVAETADRVAVMYMGRKIEEAPVSVLFSAPAHPYTRGLLAAVPRLGAAVNKPERQKLHEIPGTVPHPGEAIVGCAFMPRCDQATSICSLHIPAPTELGTQHAAACHHAQPRFP